MPDSLLSPVTLDITKAEREPTGAVRADLITGSAKAKHFVLVGFEGGTKDNIFKQERGTVQMRDWSREVEHTFNQVTDWSRAKNDSQNSTHI